MGLKTIQLMVKQSINFKKLFKNPTAIWEVILREKKEYNLVLKGVKKC